MNTTNTLTNKKRPHVASDQKPRMRGGEETANYLETSCGRLLAVAASSSDVCPINIWPKRLALDSAIGFAFDVDCQTFACRLAAVDDVSQVIECCAAS